MTRPGTSGADDNRILAGFTNGFEKNAPIGVAIATFLTILLSLQSQALQIFYTPASL